MKRRFGFSLKNVVLVTTFGWLLTFIILINYQPSCDQNDDTRGSRLKRGPPEGSEQRSGPNTDSSIQKETGEVKADAGCESGVAKDTMKDLLFFRDNIMEIQYFLDSRRSSWSGEERDVMQQMVDYLWLEMVKITEDVSRKTCETALRDASNLLSNAIQEVTSHLKRTSSDSVKYSKHSLQVQNERDCSDPKNKIVVCSLHKPCGFGCQFHDFNWCFILAFALNRTMVLDDSRWNYNRRGWTDLFLPTSTCAMQPSYGNAPFIGIH